MNKTFRVIVIALIVVGCSLFNPVIGTWRYSETTVIGGQSYYTEETLTINADGTIDFDGLLRNNITNQQWFYYGSGTYNNDDKYFSCTITFDRNDLSATNQYTLNGDYTIEGNRLRIESNQQITDYYRQ